MNPPVAPDPRSLARAGPGRYDGRKSVHQARDWRMGLPRGRFAPVLAVACLLLLGWLILMPYVGTNARQPDKAGDPSQPRVPFAGANPAVPAFINAAPFDGKRALGYVRDLCQIGPG